MEVGGGGEGGGGGGGPLDALRAHPNFEQLRAQLASNPDSLPQVLQAFGASNPEIAQAIQSDLPGFIAMMQGEDDGGEDEEVGMAEMAEAMGGAGGGQMPEMGQLMQMVIPPPAVLFVFVNYYCHRSLRVRFADHGRCLQMAGIMQLPEEERNAMLAQVRSRRPIPTAW